MFKIIIILVLLLLFSGVVNRRVFRIIIMAGLLALLIREIKHLDVCCSFCKRKVVTHHRKA